MQKLVEINSNCMDWRNNESANKAILGGATLYRTAGGNVNAIMPSLLRVTARQLAKGYNVSISANMHSECGEKGFCSNVLNGNAHAHGLVKSRIISRYNGLAPKSREDLI
ncbi:MAG: hypothetical protein KGH66_03295, partial [Candidatus Micrarchaeota archaeon]|nr:hypothetical protein [Candidatus Micrarchaeota archaeon]